MTTAVRLTDVLTPRQMEIVALAADGLTNYAIAKRLFLEQRTVEQHLYRIYSKLGLVTDAKSQAVRIQVSLWYLRERMEAERMVELGAVQSCPGHLICSGKVFCA